MEFDHPVALPSPASAAPRLPSGLACLAKAVRARDDVTRGRSVSDHERSVSGLVTLLAAMSGAGDAAAERLGVAAGVHDIGKLAVPDSILLHDGPLDGAAWSLLRSHPVVGAAILSGQQDPTLDRGDDRAAPLAEQKQLARLWEETGCAPYEVFELH